jgi:hypothetical protein
MLLGLWVVLSVKHEDPKPTSAEKATVPAVASLESPIPRTLSQSIQAAKQPIKQAAPDAAALIKLGDATFQSRWDDQRNRPFYTVEEPTVTPLRKVVAGDKLSLPLPDHGIVEVTVHASLQDEQRDTMWSIGGEIGEGEGSLYLAEDTKMDILSGVVMLRNRREAWVYERAGNGALTISERLASEIVCTGKDGLPPMGMAGATAAAAPISNGGGVVPLSSGASGSVPNCSSKPGATSVLYLDFEGGTITQTFWNAGRAITYESAGLSTNQMISVWAQVAEDYAPFDVNVTTVRASHTNAPAGRRMRIIMCKTNWDPESAGGFAAIGSFRDAGGYWFERIWVLPSGLDSNLPFRLGAIPYPSGYNLTAAIAFPSDIVSWGFADGSIFPLEATTTAQVSSYARVATHELGHTFGLLHDSALYSTGDFLGYYPGHGGSGADGWVALMGSPYGGLGQWSKGEYDDAINYGWGFMADGTTRVLQDDLAMIGEGVSGGTGNGLVADDKGETMATSALLSIDGLGAVNDFGKIHVGTDNDWFRIPISAPSAVIDLDILASGEDTNLDLFAELRDSSGAALATSAPLANRNARIGPITVNAAGNYYLVISGSWQATANTGWTRYGNLGNYAINGSVINRTVSGAGYAPYIAASKRPPDASVGIPYTFPLLATNNSTSYYIVSGAVPPGLLLNGGNLTGTPTTAGYFTFTLAAANAQGSSSSSFTMFVFGPASLDDSLDAFPIFWTTTAPPSNAAGSLWNGQRAFTNDGSDAARSGTIGANSESILSTNLKGPGKLTFYWRTSSHSSDRLIFKLDTAEQFNISGDTAWEQKTVLIPGSGTYPVSWIYRTDAGTTAGQNAGFIDQVSYVQNPVFPRGNFYAGGRVGHAFRRQIPLEGLPLPTTWALTGGTLPPGITLNSSTGELSGVPNTAGTYEPEITATNSAGPSTTYPTIYIYPNISLPAGLDAEGLVWATDTDNPWFGDNTNTHDGTDVAHSAPIRHGLSTFMQTTVTGPGTFSFWWKASTEATDDPVYFSIDGVVQSTISGETAWAQQTYNLSAGTHTLRWNYVRDNSGNGISNMVWVDQVNWVTPGPAITNALTVNWTVGGIYSIALTSDDPNATWSVTGTVPSDFNFDNLGKSLLGIPKLPRVVTFTLNATNAGGTTTSRLFTANIESSYALWARTKGLAVGTPLGDPDNDGIVNFAELAFGLNPTVRNPTYQPVSYDPATKRLRAIFNRRGYLNPDIRYEVQISTDLVNWTNIATFEEGAVTNIGALSINSTQISPAPDLLFESTVIDALAQAPARPKRYMRVKVIQK